jgi:hypothetical protein
MQNSLLLCRVDLGGKRLRQRLAVNLHSLAVGGTASADGHIRQGIASFVAFPCQTRDDACGSIVLVEGSAELLSRLRQLLLERVRLEHNGVPLVLESAEQGGDRCEIRRAGCDDLGRLELDEVLDGELLARDGVGVVFGNVRLNQALLENIAALSRRDRVSGSLSGYGAKHCEWVGWACVAEHAVACRADFLEAVQTALSLHAEERQNVTSGITLALEYHHNGMFCTRCTCGQRSLHSPERAAVFLRIGVQVCIKLVNEWNHVYVW